MTSRRKRYERVDIRPSTTPGRGTKGSPENAGRGTREGRAGSRIRTAVVPRPAAAAARGRSVGEALSEPTGRPNQDGARISPREAAITSKQQLIERKKAEIAAWKQEQQAMKSIARVKLAETMLEWRQSLKQRDETGRRQRLEAAAARQGQRCARLEAYALQRRQSVALNHEPLGVLTERGDQRRRPSEWRRNRGRVEPQQLARTDGIKDREDRHEAFWLRVRESPGGARRVLVERKPFDLVAEERRLAALAEERRLRELERLDVAAYKNHLARLERAEREFSRREVIRDRELRLRRERERKTEEVRERRIRLDDRASVLAGQKMEREAERARREMARELPFRSTKFQVLEAMWIRRRRSAAAAAAQKHPRAKAIREDGSGGVGKTVSPAAKASREHPGDGDGGARSDAGRAFASVDDDDAAQEGRGILETSSVSFVESMVDTVADVRLIEEEEQEEPQGGDACPEPPLNSAVSHPDTATSGADSADTRKAVEAGMIRLLGMSEASTSASVYNGVHGDLTGPSAAGTDPVDDSWNVYPDLSRETGDGEGDEELDKEYLEGYAEHRDIAIGEGGLNESSEFYRQSPAPEEPGASQGASKGHEADASVSDSGPLLPAWSDLNVMGEQVWWGPDPIVGDRLAENSGPGRDERTFSENGVMDGAVKYHCLKAGNGEQRPVARVLRYTPPKRRAVSDSDADAGVDQEAFRLRRESSLVIVSDDDEEDQGEHEAEVGKHGEGQQSGAGMNGGFAKYPLTPRDSFRLET